MSRQAEESLHLTPTQKHPAKIGSGRFFPRRKVTERSLEGLPIPTLTSSDGSPSEKSLLPTISGAATSQSFRHGSHQIVTSWDPLPLFLAHPQALIHAVLEVSNSSADSILRTDHRRGHSNATENQSRPRRESNVGSWAERTKDPLRKHKSSLSASITTSHLIPKLFLLTTSGYILQYSSQGLSNRLPEKILQLGKASVAFASDAIPGKHWVLQVTSESDQLEQTKEGRSKPLRHIFGLRNGDSRRMAKTFLLVFENALEFNFWMTVVRREIEALGGLQYLPDTSSESPSPSSPEQVLNQTDYTQGNDKRSIRLPETGRESLLSHRSASDRFSKATTPSFEKTFHSPVISRESISGSSVMTSADLDCLRHSDSSSVSSISAARNSTDEHIDMVASPMYTALAVDGYRPLLRTQKEMQRVSRPSSITYSPAPAGDRRRSFDARVLQNHKGWEWDTKRSSPQSERSTSAMTNISPPAYPTGSSHRQTNKVSISVTPSAACHVEVNENVHSTITSKQVVNAARDKPGLELSTRRMADLALGDRTMVPRTEGADLTQSVQDSSIASSNTGSVSKSFPLQPSLTAPGSRTTRPPTNMFIQIVRLSDCPSIPERSPAATDAHFATCFGTETPLDNNDHPLEQLPNLNSFLGEPASKSPQHQGDQTKRRRAKSHISSKLRHPPAGPPPTCPLPAIPNIERKVMPRHRDILEYGAEIRRRGTFVR